MPTYTLHLFDLRQNGPRIEVQLVPDASHFATLQGQGITTVGTIPMVALIDTGASHTVVKPGTRARLHNPPITGRSHVVSPQGEPGWHDNFSVVLIFSDTHSMPVDATEMPLGIEQADCIIGRDILANATLVYSGHSNTVKLRF